MIDKSTKVLYLMNVDWCWIRQRPHILAQMLDEHCSLTVLYPRYLTRPWRQQKKTIKPKNCSGIFQIPFANKFPALRKLQKWIIVKKLGDLHAFDMIWLTTPIYIDIIPETYSGYIIYDDMDDIVSIQTDSALARKLYICQEKVFNRADQIFVTSEYLLCSLPEAGRAKAKLIRNGAFAYQLYPVASARPDRNCFSLGYIGTISEWFDFSLIRTCIRELPNIKVELYGPNTVSVPRIAGMDSHGIVEHEMLADAVNGVDCLLMPFVVNQVTLAVDPVKLYEYISFGKCIVSVRYPEIERFSPFVYFYESEAEFLELIKRLAAAGFPPKYDAQMQKSFLTDNCWEQRIQKIKETLSNL